MKRLWQSGSAALFVGLAIAAAAAPVPKQRRAPGSYVPYPTTIAVSNFPATQPVSGTVGVNNFPASQAVTGTFWQATQPVSGTFWQATQPISGSVSVSNFPASQAVTGTFWQATQPVSGTFWQATQPVSGTVAATQSGTWTVQPGNTANTTAWKVDGSAVTQPVSGTFWQATQPVSGTVTANQGGTWTVQPGNTANTTAWKVDGSAVTQPVSGTVTANTGTLPTLTRGTQGSTGFSTQDLKDAGRSSVMITAEAVAGAASEALVTMTWSAGGAATTTGTSYPVTSGKRLRLQCMTITFVSTATTANTTRIRLRENASGTAIITSPLQWSARVGWATATFIANQSQTQQIDFPDGFEWPGGAGLAISHIEAAANGTIDLALVGFEY